MIEHSTMQEAASYASEIDRECTERDCGRDYADARATQLELGAFRAFEWLKNNGYEVIKKTMCPVATAYGAVSNHTVRPKRKGRPSD
jgi:hypothetical protein